MNEQPLVSVIIPAYNTEKFIRTALDSVLDQTYRNLQVIVVDDASTDGTARILDSYTDQRLEVIHLKTNGNICIARNVGLKRAKGSYIAFQDSDDVWVPEKIEKQVAFLEKEQKYGACFTWAEIIDEKGKPRDMDDEDVRWLHDAFHTHNRPQAEWLMHMLTRGNTFAIPSALVRGEIVRQVGLQNLTLVQLQDFEYWIRLLSITNVYIIQEELCKYRRIKDGASLSAPNETNRARDNNESVYICTHFFDYISDELFTKLFHEQFRCVDSVTAEELACERVFLLQKAYCAPEPFLACMQKLLCDEKMAELLQEKYDFAPKDFYAANVGRRYNDHNYVYLQQEALRQLREEKEVAEAAAEQLRLAVQSGDERLQSELESSAAKSEEIQRLQGEREAEALEQERLIGELTARDGELSEARAEQERLSGELTARDDELAEMKEKLDLLLESDRELERIKASRSWRVVCYLRRISRMLFPIGSKRRLFCKMILYFVKRPIWFLSICTSDRITKFFRTLYREGVDGTLRRLDNCMLKERTVHQELNVIQTNVDACKSADKYLHLQVPHQQNPLVSIVIPVYNQFDYTYACITSILKYSGDVSYEILIADDCSTDLTMQIDEIIGGLHTIHNQENLRFLLNCNNAAKQARGRYILFLNNDTQVQKNWLIPLVRLMEQDASIGMTGSKLVYPDGRLQEAGGILWQDGSAWNFGNRSDPDAPEFNYVKDVDYISGAAICIRKALWEEIGGFDERFVPAYCEDSDLAFEVRRHGYRVVYQPLSVVVHFEGVSNGTDISSGQKSYQVVNQKKFYEKWKTVLTREHFPNGENVFQARERGQTAKYLLMVDHYVPQYDKDAGSRTVFQYLKLFSNQGYHVKFIGDNFFPHQPYTQTLQQMGIEVLYGKWCADHWKAWLRENGQYIQYAFLNRPHISVKYIDTVRSYTDAFIAYYGHDLHFLREYREYELIGDKACLAASEAWKQKEFALMRKADISYYPSYVEEQEIQKISPEIKVKAIPAYLFEDVEWTSYEVEKRKNIMFIGGFGHRPNVDAVRWLAKDVMPKLKNQLPDIVVYVLGSNPPKEVTELESENLRIVGFVTDEELTQYYSKCRMVVVPLRYGAGIKGKVIEAMRYGMPVVTTSVGAEGIIGSENILSIADDAEEFAARLAALYEDEDALIEMSKKEVEYVKDNFSPQNAIRVIGPEFGLEEEKI